MNDGHALLEEYAGTGSEAAFSELVARYIDLVYGTALRLVGGDTHLAEDIAQTVFIDLARKGRGLSKEVMLGGWLHQHTYYVATKLLRGERRRKVREWEAVQMNSPDDQAERALAQVAPFLDEAITQLETQDRAAILLRFFEKRNFGSVGLAIGVSEDAARMRVSRALEKLHALLSARGVSLSAASLASILAVQAATAAPTGLAASIASQALASAGAGYGVAAVLSKLLTMTKLQAGIVGAMVVAGTATPLILQHQAQARLQRENNSLRAQLQTLAEVSAEKQNPSNSAALAENSSGVSSGQLSELLRLRGEVGALKRQVAEAKAQTQSARQALPTDSTEQERAEAIRQQQFLAKMGYTKNWMLAFFKFSEQNQGRFPVNFEEAVSLLPTEAQDETILATNQFEIVYEGSLTALTNPASVIVIREIETQQVPGGWVRTYGFADGHSEVHKAEDGNFEPWEARHTIASR